jgi:hypothetical protein
VRGLAKASSAGSNSSQGSSRGSFLRGALATRGGSADANGIGARSRRLTLVSLAVGLVMALTASPVFAAETHPYTGTSFGPDGIGGSGTFINLQSLAVDQASGNVFAYDAGAEKVYKFNAAGEPVSFSGLSGNAIEGVGGGGGNGEFEIAVAPPGSLGGTAGDVYVANNSNSLRIYGATGEPLGEIAIGAETCGVAVDPAGRVFVGIYPNEVREFNPTTNPPTVADESPTKSSGVVSGICNVAADGAGNVYTAGYFHGPISKLEGLGESSASEVDPAASTLAVDPTTDDLYANRREEFVQYGSAGNRIGSSGAGRLSASQGIAVYGATESIYAGNGGSHKVDVFGPAILVPAMIEAQWVASATLSDATLKATINPNGNPTTYRLEYGIDTSYGASTSEAGIGAGEVGQTIVNSIEGLTPETVYHYRYVVTNSVEVVEGPDRTFTTSTSFGPGASCPNQDFRTGFSANLPDCRAYEMVSPVDKRGGDVRALLDAFNYTDALTQSADNGERFTYSSYRAFGNPKAGPLTNQYMASREAGVGWASEAIIPPQGPAGTGAYGLNANFENEYKAFSADLCRGWISVAAEPVLAPGPAENYVELYRRDGCGGESYEALANAPRSGSPPDPEPELQGFSADASAVVLRANDKFTPDAQGGGLSQTYFSSGGELHLVCIRPNGVPESIGCSAGTDPALGESAFGDSALNHSGSVRHALSDDGARVYWTATEIQEGTGRPAGTGRIYLREHPGQEQSAISSGKCTEPEKACTLAVSETQSSDPARFLDASTDGSRALFEFTEGPQTGDLYEFDAATETSRLIASESLGVAGAGDDLSEVYFVSEKILPGTAGATAGKPNLYLDQDGSDTFIATLSRTDVHKYNEESGAHGSDVDWSPLYHAARVSADGQRLAFISTEPLTGYDNTDAASSLPCGTTRESVEGICDSEIYLYKAGAATPVCVSCNPNGARPEGRIVKNQGASIPTAASLPLPPNQLFSPHVLSDDGSRLFFDSYDSLLSRDTNGREDVYEWEAANSKAACEEKRTGVYVASAGGCLSLISSGESPTDSELLDASSDGRDVFFTTNASLLPQDPGLIDVYDARVGGGFPRATTTPACEGEACQGPLTPPNDPTPGSSTFNGPGNLRDKSAAKNTHKKKRHPVKKKHAKKKTHNNRRAGR